MKYYSLTNLINTGAKYLINYGERSSGKTYAALKYGVEKHLKTGEQMAIIRRYREDFRGKRAAVYFDSLTYNGKGENVIRKMSKGKYDRVVYQSSKWYLAYFDADLDKVVTEEEPMAYAFPLTEMEHDKSTSYPKITTIFFDEFMTRGSYLPDEFLLFMNACSTIIRSRTNVTIIMSANTVSLYCPYFKEMGLKHVRQQKPGTIDIYTYGDSGLKVAVEYTDAPSKGKPSDLYFAFDSPSLKMITSGEWELDIYPHLRTTYDKKDILFQYFIVFEEHTLQCEIIQKDNMFFTYIHSKSTPIKHDDQDIIYCIEPNEKRNYYKNLLQPSDELSKRIVSFFRANKVFYQSNDIGEVVNNYINQCRNMIKV
ncbi:MAG: phage DNA encapsidation protein [Bacteroidales bacterium]|nr:phage DNA encapsidation protein [Bacteroidales bacterium]